MRLSLQEIIDDLYPQVLADYSRRVAELGPPPPGFRFVLGEPRIEDKGDEFEIFFPIELQAK